MSYMQFCVACVIGIAFALFGFPQPAAVTLGALAGNVIYNLLNSRDF